MENGHYNYAGMKRIGNRFAEVFLSKYAAESAVGQGAKP
jgi:hypothetical protein